MKMRPNPLLILAAVLLVCSAAGFAQSTSKEELTVEERFLQNIEFQILREQAFSDDREMKITVLDDIEAMVEDGRISGDDEQYVFMLEYLAMEGISRKVREGGRLINAFPEVRRRACNLLGRVGGEDAAIALLTILIKDDEYMVKSEAAYALGVIGMDPGGQVVETLVYSLERMDPSRPDNNFAMAIILAIEKLADANNGIKDPGAYRALVRIASGNYIRTVKRRALEALDKLKAYG